MNRLMFRNQLVPIFCGGGAGGGAVGAGTRPASSALLHEGKPRQVPAAARAMAAASAGHAGTRRAATAARENPASQQPDPPPDRPLAHHIGSPAQRVLLPEQLLAHLRADLRSLDLRANAGGHAVGGSMLAGHALLNQGW